MTAPDDTDDVAQFGDYVLVGLIARGGMAEVYRARKVGEARVLAVKVMRPSLAKEARFVEMFEREAALALLLRHPNIVETLSAGRTHGQPYIAMEYVSGADLSTFVRRAAESGTRLPVPLAMYIAHAMAAGLGFAHSLVDGAGRALNIVNRDVSPSNVRLGFDGAVKILDFGIAQALTKYTSEIGVLKGKLSYMSPEQVRGLPVDARTDIFSVGIVLHELLTGQRLFRGETEFALMDRVQNVEIPVPSSINRRVPPELDAIVRDALAREPSARTASATALAAALEPLIAGYQFSPRELAQTMAQLFRAELQAEPARITRVLTAEPPELVELVIEDEGDAPRISDTAVQRKRPSTDA